MPCHRHHQSNPFDEAEGDPDPEPQPSTGATPLRQFVLFHRRSLLKQHAHFSTLFLDIVLGMASAVVMGTAAIRDQGSVPTHGAYVLLAPSPKPYVQPMMAMFFLIAISCASASGLRAFGGEQVQYWREAATGSCNRLAYYLGTFTAEFYRLWMTALHFTFIAYLMWSPFMSFWSLCLIIFLMFTAMDAQSSMLGQALHPHNAPLMCMIVAVFVTLLNGFPEIPALGYVAFSWYLTEAMITDNTNQLSHFYDFASMFEHQWDYSLGQYGVDIVIVLAMITVYRIAGFVLMIALNRDKQK